MKNEEDLKVYGSYEDPKDVAEAIKELRKEGYSKEEIKVYSKGTSQTNADETSQRSNMDNETITEESNTLIVSDEERRQETNKEDMSFWEQVKDYFTSDSYNYDEESKNPNYRKENDVLYPHREDIAKGNRVIVLDKANENQTRVNI